MGLQFNDNGVTRTLTLADMATMTFQEAYSDLYKGINGFRPRGHSVESMLHFFDTYEEQFAQSEKEEAAARANRLAYLNQKHGQVFDTLTIAERFNEQAAYNRFMAKMEAESEAEAVKAEFKRRFSPAPVIDAWEHGAI